MTRSSSICKTLPARSTDATHETHRHNNSDAFLKQQNLNHDFPIQLLSAAEHEGGRKGEKKMTERHENNSITCVNSLILLVLVVVNVFISLTDLWPTETSSSKSARFPSPLKMIHQIINHAAASTFHNKCKTANAQDNKYHNIINVTNIFPTFRSLQLTSHQTSDWKFSCKFWNRTNLHFFFPFTLKLQIFLH